MRKISKMQARVNLATRPAQISRTVGSFGPKQQTKVWDGLNELDVRSRDQLIEQEATDALDQAADLRVLAAKQAALKGKHGGNCNRTDCQRPGAFFRNCGSYAYYCLECTLDIGGFSLRTQQDPMELYPQFDENFAEYEPWFRARNPDPRSQRMVESHLERARNVYARARQIYQENMAKA